VKKAAVTVRVKQIGGRLLYLTPENPNDFADAITRACEVSKA